MRRGDCRSRGEVEKGPEKERVREDRGTRRRDGEGRGSEKERSGQRRQKNYEYAHL